MTEFISYRGNIYKVIKRPVIFKSGSVYCEVGPQIRLDGKQVRVSESLKKGIKNLKDAEELANERI
jgi:hypothetical protein